MERTTLREGCLTEAVLQAFFAGQLPVEDLGRVDEHLDSCLECQSVFMKLASQGECKSPPRTRFKSIVGEMALGHPPTRGGAVGRYLVLDLLGAGSMGAVYAAYDPQLDRKVAIKVLRPDRQPGTRADRPESGLKGSMASDEALRGRLLKEGQALARLSHPNVTSVYDVGVVDGRVFIAMEFVEGQTLQRWLSQRQRSWKEVLQIYLKAGEGLAAAHAAGLVHRDFKPENVMVGRDGRVRVTDFGLVRIAASDSGDGSEKNQDRASLGDRSPAPAQKEDPSSTQPGTLVGTPAYMAPEQFSGKAADARSDQFSFCVALFEALYGKRPFVGKSTAQMAKSTLEGRVEEVAANKVPWRIHRTLLKGLAVAPEDRFASMDALLRELAKEPAARWRWALACVGALGFALAVTAMYQRAWNKRQQICKGGEQYLAGVWDDAKRAAVRTAYQSTGVEYGRSTFERKAAQLDAYAQKWVAAWTGACEATRLSGSQSEVVLDKRQSCLKQRLFELKAIADLLQTVKTVEEVKRLSNSLSPTPLDPCSNLDALQLMPPPPTDPATRLALEEHGRAAIASVKALLASKQYPEALAGAEKLAQANRIEYQPLQAEAQFYLGSAQAQMGNFADAEAAYLKALLLAESSHHDRLTADASLRLAWVTGAFLGKLDQSRLWEEHTRAAIERIGGNDRLTATLLSATGAVLSQEGRFAEALEHYQKAAQINERLSPDQPFAGLHNVSLSLIYLGRLDEAEAALRKALALTEKATRGRDAISGLLHNDWTLLLLEKGDWRQGLESAEKTRAMNERGFDGDFSYLFTTLEQLVVIHRELQEPQKAIEYAQRLLQLAQEPPEWVILARNTAPPVLGEAHLFHGTALAAAGRHQDALAEHQKALALYQKTYIPPIHMGELFRALGEDWLRLGQPKKALELLEKALKTRANFWAGSTDTAEIRFLLAQALWETKGDRRRAHQLAIEARDAYAGRAQPGFKLAAIDRWLGSHGNPPRTVATRPLQ